MQSKRNASELVGYRKSNQEFYSIHPSSPDITRDNPRNAFQRSLQTLAVLYHVVTIYPLIPVFLILLYATQHPLQVALAILISLLLSLSSSSSSTTTTSRSQLLRSLPLWTALASYFPIRLYRSAPLPKTRKYIFGYHPHGVLSHGAFAAFATEALGFSELFPGLENSLLTLDSSFKIPIYRDYLLTMGLNSVSRPSCQRLLSTGGSDGKGTGRAITIVVGGAKESLEAVPDTMNLILRDRKGFVRMAVRTGADLVPVLGFGENDLYSMVELDAKSVAWKVQMYLKKGLGFTVPFFYARGPFGFDLGMTPHRRPVNIVVGRPIRTVRMEGQEVDEGYVDELHARYVQELRWIWEEWKDVFAVDRVEEMKIVG